MKGRVKDLGARVAKGKGGFAKSLLQRLEWDLKWT